MSLLSLQPRVCHQHNEAYCFHTANLKWRAWSGVKHIVNNVFHSVPQKTAYGFGTSWSTTNKWQDVPFLEEYSFKIWIFMKLEMLMKVLKSFEKGSWCPQILEITLAPCFVYLLDFKSHILFVCPYFPGAHMKCQVWFFLNAAEIKLCLHWIQLEVAKGLSLLYCTFIWIPGHYFPQASVCVCVCVCVEEPKASPQEHKMQSEHDCHPDETETHTAGLLRAQRGVFLMHKAVCLKSKSKTQMMSSTMPQNLYFGSHYFTWIHEGKGQRSLFSPWVWALVDISEAVKMNPFITF